jgi:hypothetical protein
MKRKAGTQEDIAKMVGQVVHTSTCIMWCLKELAEPMTQLISLHFISVNTLAFALIKK